MDKIKQNKIKIEELSVFIGGNRFTKLIDRRIMTNGINFGTIESVAKNLGITIKEVDNGIIASAPKSRLQLFVEKLHFSGIKYSELSIPN